MSGKKRTRFNNDMDIFLLKEVINHNPFVNKGQWQTISTLINSTLGKQTSDRSCSERTNLLVSQFRTDNLKKIGRYCTCVMLSRYMQN